MFLRSTVTVFSAFALMAASGVLAAPKPKVNDLCMADFHKNCPSESLGRGVVIRCARAHIDAVTPDCKSAVEAANALNAAKRAAKASRKASAKAEAPASAPAAS